MSLIATRQLLKVVPHKRYISTAVLVTNVPITKCAETLGYLHDVTNVSWCLLLPSLAVTARFALGMPLTIAAQKAASRREIAGKELSRVAKPNLVGEISRRKGNLSDQQKRDLLNKELKRAWKQLVQREQCQLWKLGLPMISQICVWTTMSLSIRRLCYLDDDNIFVRMTRNELAIEHCLLLPNLLVPHPSLGVMAVIVMLVNSEIPETRKTPFILHPKLYRVLKMGSQVMILSLIPLSTVLPSILPLYWLTSASAATVATLILMAPRIRRFLRIPTHPDLMKTPYLDLGRNALKRIKRTVSLFRW